MTTYYRIQQADRDPQDLLNPDQFRSASWHGDDERYGVSVTRSLDSLIRYAQETGLDAEGGVVVELRGTPSGDTDEDAHLGAELVCPTEICSVTPVTDEQVDEILAAWD